MVEAQKQPILRESFNPNLRLAVLYCLAGAIALGPVSAYGQSAGALPPSAVTGQLRAAKKIFITPTTPKNEDMAYFRQVMVETIEIWRLYEQVPESAGADLIFEPSIKSNSLGLAVRATSRANVLWVFSRPVKKAFTPSGWENNFASTIPVLLDDVRQATGQAAPPILSQNAPSPTQFSTPPKVFISNVAAGDDSEKLLLGNSPYAGGVGQTYNKFYDAVQASGRYELAMTPAQADLVFEIRYADPSRTIGDNDLYYAQLTLVVWDRKTGAVLRAATVDVQDAFRAATADKNFTTAIQTLLNESATAIGPPAAKPQPVQTALSLPHNVPDAPVPSQIGPARKVFIAKPGEGRVYPSEEALDLYGDIQIELQKWGRYELVPAAGDADLVLEPSAVGGMLRLSVLDPGTLVALWAFRWDRYYEGSKTKEAVHTGAFQLIDTLRKLDARAIAPVSSSPNGGKR